MKRALLFGLSLLCGSSLMAQDTASTGMPKPETFEMEWGDSSVVMQKYFVVFLKSGPERSQSKEESARIQERHLAHLNKLYEMGKTSITGPFGDDGAIRGMVIYNTATLEEAKSLAEQDPAVKAGRLTVEVHPFWSAKGSTLK